MASKKLLPPTYLLITIVLMTAFHFVLPLTQIIPGLWRFVGLLPLAGGIGFNLIADRALHQANTTVKPFEPSTALITTGVFQISRHPMYLGFVLILVGLAILLGSLTPYFVIPIFAILMDRVFIQVEERMLKEQFGPTWLTYKARVRRWI
jgi:protein-S-isoprenylcysteine O-methyltransferase Ste14